MQFALTPKGGALPQKRLGRDFKPERLVIGEMPVEAVQLQQRHQVKKPQDEVDREEMPRAVQMLAAPAEAGAVGDRAAGHLPVAGFAQVQERDRGMVQTRRPTDSDSKPVRRNG